MFEISFLGIFLGIIIILIGLLLYSVGENPVILLIIGLFLVYMSVYYKYDQKEVILRQNLIGARSGLEVHGGLFLIQSSNNYIGWIKKRGGKQKFPMPADSIIYERDDVEPHYEERCTKNRYLFHSHYSECKYSIYVPSNSVKTEFDIK
jgi:hypothetical protein